MICTSEQTNLRWHVFSKSSEASGTRPTAWIAHITSHARFVN